eukprot:CAMPEP_0194750844 /NCGR_PEP_ID=MMETSP0323_2-20130528/4943_1 /TAXON_ID=2866 ORGANISM="Crypthecodinium cohnii, Strain Seligo" /NCGR_SAMPLE_ID=MMETSP0323_2 /ASSEMBLY_ACC=CAM_ASM_000346 /LENGTH=287 /DNA_ID=CAMNT_0039666941 /DNA_START=56 /DNA_END=919 /DNA_ORIENTATION=-
MLNTLLRKSRAISSRSMPTRAGGLMVGAGLILSSAASSSPRQAFCNSAPPGDSTGFPRDASDSRKRISPSNARNKGPILEVLNKYLPVRFSEGDVLEIASGTGEHITHFATNLPQFTFQPSEYCGHASPNHEAQSVEDICESIIAWTEKLPNVKRPIPLDASAPCWHVSVDPPAGVPPKCVGMIASNIAHIAPPEVLEGLLAGASRILQPAGLLFLYGPFAIEGKALEDGNASFDAKLKSKNKDWGLRPVGAVVRQAELQGLQLISVEEMPSDNKTIVFTKRRTAIL